MDYETDVCELCDKPLSGCKCDVSDDAEDTMFNPVVDKEVNRNGDLSSM